jgi:hypothetical protein
MLGGQKVAERRGLAREFAKRYSEEPPRARGREVHLDATLAALVLGGGKHVAEPHREPSWVMTRCALVSTHGHAQRRSELDDQDDRGFRELASALPAR